MLGKVLSHTQIDEALATENFLFVGECHSFLKKKEIKVDKLDILRMALNPSGYLIDIALKKSMESFSSSTSEKDITPEAMNEEAIKANIQSTVLAEQAKVEQEISIAKRILIAEKVEIEEFYDTSGSGGIGAKAESDKLSFGAHGEGKKVTRRVIKFKGFNSEAIAFLASSAEDKLLSATEKEKPSS